MIERLRTIESTTTVPYDNIALEAYLLLGVKPGECILYLWQNRHTVVIGRNQNCWKECNCRLLQEEEGYLARRLSGGGAVFHDLGNLNFTFLMRKEDYDIKRQTEVILQAVRMYEIHAERTGRNDIVVDGRKFSGNAFYQSGDCCYHHGTILMNVDKDSMSKYLNVSKEKLQSKGVDSVRSRVTNLIEYAPQITADGMKERLTESFARVYGLPPVPLNKEEIDWKETGGLTEQFSSWDWLYGRKIPFTCKVERRFSWGEAQLQLGVEGGLIKAVNLYTDGMDVELVERLKELLPGVKYQKAAMSGAVRMAPAKTELQEIMRQEIGAWFEEVI